MTIRKAYPLVALALTGAISSASAAIIAFSAESGTIGSNFEVLANGDSTTGQTVNATVSGSLTGSIIAPLTNDFSGSPQDAGQIVSYSVNLDASTTYDLYVRFYIDSSGRTTPGDGSQEDSLFLATDFGPTTVAADADWWLVNNLSPDQPANPNDDPDGSNLANDSWQWVQLSGWTVVETVGQYTTTVAGDYTFEYGNRELGLWVDGFAFVTGGDTPTVAELDAALVPEPTTFALIAGLLVLGFAVRRRSMND